MSTPVSVGPQAHSINETGLGSSDLSSLQTTPACSPPPSKSSSHVLIPGPSSLVLKLSLSDAARLQKIKSSAPLRRSKRLSIISQAGSEVSYNETVDYSSTSFTNISTAADFSPTLANGISPTLANDVCGSLPTDTSSALATGVFSAPGSILTLSSISNVSHTANTSVPSKRPTFQQSKRSADDADFVDIEPTHNEDDVVETASHSLLTRKRAKKSPSSPKTKTSAKSKTSAKPSAKYYQSVQEDYPEPYGQPPLWANTRQALCETLPYYKAYQSGPYTRGGYVYGLLIDKEGSSRDVFNEEIIITRVGGGKVKVDGVSVQQKDTTHRASNFSFQNNMKDKVPIAVIAGQGNKLSPSKLPHYYNALAWFHVTDVWFEMTGTNVKYGMVRLEKINLSEKSWWSAAETPLPDPQRNLDLVRTRSSTCLTCQLGSTEIFQQGWCCLNTLCSQFFNFLVPSTMSRGDFYDALVYNSNFLGKRTLFQGTISEPLVPQIPAVDEIGTGTLGYESKFGRGVVCPDCGGCSRRTQWKQWSCENPNCSWVLPAAQPVVSITQAIGGINPANYKEWCDGLIRNTCMPVAKYEVFEYVIPGECDAFSNYTTNAGIIRHYVANDVINSQPNGPNDLFRQMQEGEIGLQRKPCRLHGLTGEMLTNHFYMNWGAPYKFVAPVNSKSFSQAPSPILRALMRMTWAGYQTINGRHGDFVPFNELLSVGYFEDGSMGYHDDGESTLGPSVASLSLGSSSTMSFRPKKKAKIGPESKNQRGEKPALLQITLNHGDMIVMHGADIQKLYEHQVIPHGKLRFVLTCRHIVPEKIPNAADRAKSLIDGTLPADIEQYAYDGDINAQLIPSSEAPAAEETISILKALIQSRSMSAEHYSMIQQILADNPPSSQS